MQLSYPVASNEVEIEYMGFRGDLETNLNILSEIGYKYIEFFVAKPAEINTEDLLKSLKKHNMLIATIGTTPMLRQDNLSLLAEDQKIRNLAVVRLKEYIDLASKLKTNITIGKSRGKIFNQNREMAMNHLKEDLCKLCDYALARDVEIYIEPQNKKNIDNLITIEEMKKFIEIVNRENLKIHIDTMHLFITENPPLKSLEKIKNIIGFIHLSDFDRDLPKENGVDFIEFFAFLRKNHYSGLLSIEVKQDPNSLETAKNAFKIFNYLLKER